MLAQYPWALRKKYLFPLLAQQLFGTLLVGVDCNSAFGSKCPDIFREWGLLYTRPVWVSAVVYEDALEADFSLYALAEGKRCCR